MGRLRRVLFASDFSPASRPAFAKAVEMARDLRADLVVAHVLSRTLPVDGVYVTPGLWDTLRDSARAAAQTELDRLARAARKRGVRATTVLREGVTADQLVRLASSQRAGLLVMGTHGRTGVSRLVMGSIATRVVATSRCPVLTVRAR
jgi:nucleotide-binding universal stress UspA family protein